MPRPPTPLGTHGTVRVYEYGPGYRAQTYFRDFDGKRRLVERNGSTKAAARRALAEAIRDLHSPSDAKAVINRNSKVAEVAELWMSGLSDLGRSPSTIQAYRDRLNNQVLPALGEVRLRELSVGLIDRHLSTVRSRNGAATAKLTRSVLSGICNLACRHDAMGSAAGW